MKKQKEMKLDININTKKIVLVGSVVAGLTVSAVVTASMYFNIYQWNYRSPVILQTPVVITKRVTPEVQTVQAIEATPSAQPVEGVKGHSIDELISIVHRLESSSGTNKAGLVGYCEAQGLTNEYGYDAPNKRCFTTTTEAEQRVYRWFSEHITEFNGHIDSALCYYNTGILQPSCQYSVDYHSIKGE